MCDHGLQSQCETTQNVEHGTGASLFGYTKLYGQIPGAQAELLRVPQAQYGPIKVPEGPSDDRFLFLSDILPTAWQGVEYASVPKGGSLVVLGLGPVGDFACRIAQQRGIDRVVGVDLVPERLERQRRRGVTVLDVNEFPKADDLLAAVRELTDGRGPDAVIDAVGMEAHGSPAGKLAHQLTSIMPDRFAERLMTKIGIDRLGALHAAIDMVRRGGTISVLGVYGGMTDPMPMMTLFDKQIQLRMGQANVKRWVDDILPLLNDDDPLGVDTFATHHVELHDAADAYATFQKKQDGAVKIVFKP
jgi:threonine dehydrogenase-like Zn-dependent dehydrogenase